MEQVLTRKELIKIKQAKSGTISDSELIRKIALYGIQTGDKSLYYKIKKGFEINGLYPHSLTSLEKLIKNK